MKHLKRYYRTLAYETEQVVQLLEAVGFEQAPVVGKLDRELCRPSGRAIQVVLIRQLTDNISSIRLIMDHRVVGQAVAFGGNGHTTAEMALLRLYVAATDDRPYRVSQANEQPERGQRMDPELTSFPNRCAEPGCELDRFHIHNLGQIWVLQSAP